MRTKHHYSTFLIALLLGLMMTTGTAWAQDTERPRANGYQYGYPKTTTPTKIEVRWNPGEDNVTAPENLRYRVWYKKASSTEQFDTGPYLTGQTDYVITGLEPLTEYLITVEVRDEANNFSNEPDRIVRTMRDTEKPTPRGYVSGYPKAISPTEIEVKWNKGTDNITAQEDLQYWVSWETKDGTIKHSPELTDETEYTISDLEPNTEYIINVRVWDKCNSDARYGEKTVKTPPPPDTENPKPQGYVDGYPKAISPTEIEVKWNPAKDNATAQEDLKYKVVWIIASSLVDRMDWGMAERSDYLQTCEYKISGLKPNTEYLVDVIVSDKANNLGSYGEKSITPPAAETPKPEPEPKPEPKPEPGPSETVLVSSVMLDQPKVSIDGDRASFQLKASVLPANATNSELQWSSSNPSVASVEAASTASLLKAGVTGKAVTVHIHKKGKAEITAQAMDGSGKSASCQVNVLSTVGNIEAAATRIYALGSTLRLTLPQAAVVRIYNVSGALVQMLNASAGDTSVALSAGVYVVRVGDTVQKVRIE